MRGFERKPLSAASVNRGTAESSASLRGIGDSHQLMLLHVRAGVESAAAWFRLRLNVHRGGFFGCCARANNVLCALLHCRKLLVDATRTGRPRNYRRGTERPRRPADRILRYCGSAAVAPDLTHVTVLRCLRRR